MASSATPTTVTSIIRAVIAENGNKPMRLTKVFDEVVKRAGPEAVKSKNAFKRNFVEQMFKRGELVKAHTLEEVNGKMRDFYAMRLKVNAVNRRSVPNLGPSAAAVSAASSSTTPAAAPLA
jgi:hypothetical protein